MDLLQGNLVMQIIVSVAALGLIGYFGYRTFKKYAAKNKANKRR